VVADLVVLPAALLRVGGGGAAILESRRAARGKKGTWGIAIALATGTSAACFWLDDGSIGLFS